MNLRDVTVIEHVEVQGGYRLLVMDAPDIAAQVQPGQFIHLQIPDLRDALLRRPFSIYNAENNRLSVLYKGVGVGTRWMADLKPGDPLSVMGPLGHGFPIAEAGGYPVLVAGGYGMAALYIAARESRQKGTAFFGGASAGDILCVPEFEALGWEVRVTTEDGSLGMKGIVTDAMDEWLAQNRPEGEPEYFVCGPSGMLKAVGERAMKAGTKAWISLDNNMCCGVGACLTCVQKIRTADGAWEWQRACREGPVFECREVIWDGEESVEHRTSNIEHRTKS
ncbi:MAG: dihydroorotate dehydrogenase electron transfer subunit [Verrucomicrobia bacterium]|nr:dihydroorotate dehydrogenase electron transfer subunit [Verrucomicrobiota bacterium]